MPAKRGRFLFLNLKKIGGEKMNISRMPQRMSLEYFIRNRHWDGVSGVEIGLFYKALHTAINCHKNQKRESGGEYYEHVLVVADISRCLNFNTEIQIVGLLHDVMEDSNISYEEVRKHFGLKVADIVQLISKNNESDYWEQLYLGAQIHFELIFIKMIDRWHNLTTVYGFRDLRRQIKYLEETLGPFNDLLAHCQSLIPESHLADYDELWTTIYHLAQRRLQRTRKKLSNNLVKSIPVL